MIGVVRVKPGVKFDIIAPAGFRILSAFDQVAARLGQDITITSGTDGDHSGPEDPHKKGEAYDARSKDKTLEERNTILSTMREILGTLFFIFLENPGTDQEHFHAQRRKGTIYPPEGV